MSNKKKKSVKTHRFSKSNIEKYKEELSDLIGTAHHLLLSLTLEFGLIKDPKEKRKFEKIKKYNFSEHYEIWYSEAYEVIRQILPNRLDDFKNLYKLAKRKDIDYSTYTISDYINGIAGINEKWEHSAYAKFQQQITILKAAERRFESSLFDIKRVVQADIFDSEIEAARELHKKGFLRGSGAVAGVVLEKHLGQVCEDHKIKISKKNPTISDYSGLLKKHNVIETPEWRFIQRLGDLRNLCDHDKKREPTKSEVQELIDGVDKITKTLY